MREIAFIKQNKEKWLEVENFILGKVKKNPDELSSLYINLINDLSYSQTFYPKSKTTVYLNYLSTQIYQKIYKTQRVKENRIKAFFATEVPLIVYENRKTLALSFIIFSLFVAIGMLSTLYDPEFSTSILGEDYINMTIENIKSGNPVGVYQSGSNWGTTFGIIQNNLAVSAKLFIYGIFGGLGTLYILMNNGIMLGTFQTLFYQYQSLGQSMRGIWIHGAFEIFAIVIDGFAGLVLGAFILFPKTYSRLHSFKSGFNKAFKIYLSTVPFIIVAGILEGFITRYALKMNIVLNLIIILGSFAFIGYYYLIYPKIVFQKTSKNFSQKTKS